MVSNQSVINDTLPLLSNTSMSLTRSSNENDTGLNNRMSDLANLARLVNTIGTQWAPAALLSADTSLNTTLLANSSDNWEQFGTSVQLECIQCSNWTNWTNYNQSDPNPSSGSIESIKSFFDISGNTSANIATNITLNNESTTFATFFTNDSQDIDTIVFEADIKIHHPFLAVFLAIICIIVVFGNTLTMLSVYRERYLHTVTNYFVASLAVSDCLVGAVVMPFSVIHETMNKLWIFGQDWSAHNDFSAIFIIIICIN